MRQKLCVVVHVLFRFNLLIYVIPPVDKLHHFEELTVCVVPNWKLVKLAKDVPYQNALHSQAEF